MYKIRFHWSKRLARPDILKRPAYEKEYPSPIEHSQTIIEKSITSGTVFATDALGFAYHAHKPCALSASFVLLVVKEIWLYFKLLKV